MRGSFKNKKAKIASINLKRTKVTLEGLQRTKKDGTKVNVFFRPNSLQIQSLNLEDSRRHKVLKGDVKKAEKKESLSKKDSEKSPEKNKGEKSKNAFEKTNSND